MADPTQGAASFDEPSDAGKGQEGVVRYWVQCLEMADKEEKNWRKAANATVRRYRDEEQIDNGTLPARELGTQFNILNSNVRILHAAIYNAPPKPDIRPRWPTGDKLNEAVAQVLERSVGFSIDKYDVDNTLNLSVNDMLLPGRAVDRLRYEPTFNGDQIVWERVAIDHVQWRNFRRGPGRVWAEVPWVAFEHFPTKKESIRQFPDVAALIQSGHIGLSSVDTAPDDDGKENKDKAAPEYDVLKRLRCWEIWDKTSGKIIWIAPNYGDRPLKTDDDGLQLEGFFPIPRPLYATEQSDTLVPMEDYRSYADQAKELDRVTWRITKIVGAMKIRGAYDGTMGEIGKVLSADDNILVPVENAAVFQQGGFEKAIWLMPLDVLAKVLQSLYQQRQEIKQIIYETTGIADIVRGSTDPNETLGAQQLKAQSAVVSIRDRQKSVQRYARDIIRMCAEIIGNHFQPATLKAMTGVELPTAQEKDQQLAQMQQQLQAAQMAAEQASHPQAAVPQGVSPGPPGPIPNAPMQGAGPALAPQAAPAPDPDQIEEMQQQFEDLQSTPTWEDVMAVLHSDQIMSYRIDIETDSTIAGDVQRDQQMVSEMLQGMGTFLQAAIPGIQTGILPVPAAKALLLAVTRRFKMGREVEEAIDGMSQGMANAQQEGPSADEIAQAQAQIEQQTQALQEQGKQVEAAQGEADQASQANDQAQADLEMQSQKLNEKAVEQALEKLRLDAANQALDAAHKQLADAQTIAGLQQQLREQQAVQKVKDEAASQLKALDAVATTVTDSEKRIQTMIEKAQAAEIDTGEAEAEQQQMNTKTAPIKQFVINRDPETRLISTIDTVQ